MVCHACGASANRSRWRRSSCRTSSDTGPSRRAGWHQLLRKAKKLRTEYDHIMLQFHDQMKLDADYQKNVPQLTMPFVVGSVWMFFSDHALHAAMSGQYMRSRR